MECIRGASRLQPRLSAGNSGRQDISTKLIHKQKKNHSIVMKCKYRGEKIYEIEMQYAKTPEEKEKIKKLIDYLRGLVPGGLDCDLEAETENGFCIFHDPDYWREHPEELISRLENEIRRGRGRFIGYHFPKVDFTKILHDNAWHRDVYFCLAKFHESVEFQKTRFSKADFTGATFSERTYFSGATFSEANFSDATFSGAVFTGATFSEWVGFSGATFSRWADFFGATFSEAYFRGATFSELTNFSGATFLERAVFTHATFSGQVYFDRATFSRADFNHAILRFADFSRVVFNGLAEFTETFFEFSSFTHTEFKEAAIFEASKPELLRQRAQIIREEANRQKIPEIRKQLEGLAQHLEELSRRGTRDSAIVFLFTRFRQPKLVSISGWSFENLSFLRTDTAGIFLIPEKPEGRTKQILDEKLLRIREKEPSKREQILDANPTLRRAYETVERYLNKISVIAEYKNLRKNLESNRMFTQAADLFKREMALTREATPSTAEKAAHIIYSALSEYGESITRPLVLLALLIIGLATLITTTIYTISTPTQFLTYLPKSIGMAASVVFQVKSFSDIKIAEGVALSDKLPLILEVAVRLFSLVIMGNLYITLRRRLERK